MYKIVHNLVWNLFASQKIKYLLTYFIFLKSKLFNHIRTNVSVFNFSSCSTACRPTWYLPITAAITFGMLILYVECIRLICISALHVWSLQAEYNPQRDEATCFLHDLLKMRDNPAAESGGTSVSLTDDEIRAVFIDILVSGQSCSIFVYWQLCGRNYI